MKRLCIMLGVLGSIVAATAACDDMLVAVEPLGGGGGGTAATTSMSATSLATTVVTQTTSDMTSDVATTTGTTTGGCGDQMPVGSLEQCAGSQAATSGGGITCESCVRDDTLLEWVSICSTDEGCQCFFDGVLMCQCALANPCAEPTCCPAPWGAFGAN
jgi:hypothetical protein